MTHQSANPDSPQAITPEPVKARIGPIGFHMFAVHFLYAARGIPADQNRFSPVPYYLYSRAIELAFKAFLLAKQVPLARLKRKFGHNLERLLDRAKKLGLAEFVALTAADEDEIRKANEHYANKRFEYFELLSAILGHVDLPNLVVLDRVAESLVKGVERACLGAVNE